MTKQTSAETRTPKDFTHLLAISSLDGRFRGRVEDASQYFSEFATMKYRVFVEVEYLLAFLEQIKKSPSSALQKKIRFLAENFSLIDAQWIWQKDLEINHDNKAVEYFLAEKLRELRKESLINYVHFGLTSQDIDSPALALQLRDYTNTILKNKIAYLINVLNRMAVEYKSLVMLGRTHGQVAVPTTAGKELAYFAYRLKEQYKKLKTIRFGAKMSGSVGTYSAHVAAYPAIDWPEFFKAFLGRLGLGHFPIATQVEPYDEKVEFIQIVKRINLIVMAIDQDMWRYLALGYLSLRDESGHVGSSTMPQKVNPIGFEMSENYTSLANGLFDVIERRLPLNRWQRDLTDKYVLRDLGQALVMSSLSYESTAETLEKISFNKGVVDQELANHWECIAEGIQTILRTTAYTTPYEKLKELTRGKRVTKEDYERFIDQLEVTEEIKERLRNLSPWTYIGVARHLAEQSSK